MTTLDHEIQNLLPVLAPMTRPRLHVLQAVATAGLCRWRWSGAKLREFLNGRLVRRVHGTGSYEVTARGCRLLSDAELWYRSNT